MILPLTICVSLILCGLLYVALVHGSKLWLHPSPSVPQPRRIGTPTRLLIILGSGGHTAEMLLMLRDLDCQKYTQRSYVVSSGDDFSVGKAEEFEEGLKKRYDEQILSNGSQPDDVVISGAGIYGSYDVSIVPRARKIHQSLFTTPWTSLKCLLACFRVLRGIFDSTSSPSNTTNHKQNYHLDRGQANYPDLILANGPATSVIVILASLILRICRFPGTKGKMRTIYVESWARVRRLSLSGKILLPVVDRFLVQWEQLLQVTGGKAEFLGVLVM